MSSDPLVRLLQARGRDDLAVELARARPRVRTPAGAKKYGEPIGAYITPDVIAKAKQKLRALSDEHRARKDAIRGATPDTTVTNKAKTTAKAVAGQVKNIGKDKLPPLSDEEYQEHFDKALARYNEVKRAHSTDVTEFIDNAWKPERAVKQAELLDAMYAKADAVPSDGKALFSGGLGGAGKGTVLGQHIGVPKGKYFTIDADAVKEEMIRRGMVPKVEGLSPAESAGLIHDESAYLAKALMRRAIADKKNVILDLTMAEAHGGTVAIQERLDLLEASGYSSIDAVFVDVPVPVAQARAMGRHRAGLELARNGQGFGGRMVPPDVIAANAPPENEPNFEFWSRNRRVFESYKDRYTNWEVWDNSQVAKRVDGSPGFSVSVKDLTEKTQADKLQSGVTGTAKEQAKAGEQDG